LIDIGQGDRVASCILDIDRHQAQGQKMAERIDRHTNLRSTLAPRSFIPGTGATFRRGPQRAAINNRGLLLFWAARRQAQHSAQILRQGIKTPRCQPPMGLLLNHMRGQEIVRHGAPRDAIADHITQIVEPLVQRILRSGASSPISVR
jgi:hypothetical protein